MTVAVNETEDASASGGLKRKKSSRSSEYDVEVTTLQGTVCNFQVDKHAKGEVLFSKVNAYLNVTEASYVGLSFTDVYGHKCWLDVHKQIQHQLKQQPPSFNYGVKFYEPEPAQIRDEFLRYLLYLQLRDDIVSGRLQASTNLYTILGSYTAQAELGDYIDIEDKEHYLDPYVFSPDQDHSIVQRIVELHKEHSGQSPAQAELNFLEIAKRIPYYGVALFSVKNKFAAAIQVALAAIGVSIYSENDRQNMFRWQNIKSILYKKRTLSISLIKDEQNSKRSHRSRGEENGAVVEEQQAARKPVKQQLEFVFVFEDVRSCKQCYKQCIEYHAFFRLKKPDPPRKKYHSLKIGSSFRYSDRTLYQLRQPAAAEDGPVGEGAPPERKPSFVRSPSKRFTHPSEKADDPVFEEPDAAVETNEELFAAPDVSAETELESADHITSDGASPEATECAGVEESDVQYEEFEIDETNPEDEKYDPAVWSIISRSLADGTQKRYRRRIIVTTETSTITTETKYILHRMPSVSQDEEDILLEETGLNDTDLEIPNMNGIADFSMSEMPDIISAVLTDLPAKELASPVEESGIVAMEMPMEESVSSITFPVEEMQVVAMELPVVESEITFDKVPEQESEISIADVSMAESGIEMDISEVSGDIAVDILVDGIGSEAKLTAPEQQAPNVDMDDVFDDLSNISRSLEDAELSLHEEEERKRLEREQQELRLAESAEKLRLASERAASATPPKSPTPHVLQSPVSILVNITEATPEESKLTTDAATEDDDEEDYELVSEGACEDGEDGGVIIRTASLLRQKRNDDEDTAATRRVSADENDHVVSGNSMSMPRDHKFRHSYANDLEDPVNYYKHRNSNSLHREKKSSDYGGSNIGLEQENVLSHREGGTEILYTAVTDTIDVEQGTGGFVKAVRAKHESVLRKDDERVPGSDHPRHSKYSSSSEHPSTDFEYDNISVKGHVETSTVNFEPADSDDDHLQTILTKSPPAVATKPTFIIPASTQLPNEVMFQVHDSSELASDLSADTIESMEVPEVETMPIIFDQPPLEDQIAAVHVGLDESVGVVETHAVHIGAPSSSSVVTSHIPHIISPTVDVPTQSANNMQVPTIVEIPASPIRLHSQSSDVDAAYFDVGPSIDSDGDTPLNVSCTHDPSMTIETRETILRQIMPTEYITHTFTVHGDSSSLTEEDLQRMRNQDLVFDGMSDYEVTSTQTVNRVQKVTTTKVERVVTMITEEGCSSDDMNDLMDEAISHAAQSVNDSIVSNDSIIVTSQAMVIASCHSPADEQIEDCEETDI